MTQQLTPFNWETRAPQLQEGLFFIPDYYFAHDTFTLPHWSSKEIFGNDNPVALEYCSGNGAWIIEKALQHPEKNWIAVEKRFDRIKKIYRKRNSNNLKNLFVVYGEALCATREYFPSDSIDEIFINFPDPWPKKRHIKHRLMTPTFLEQMARILHSGAPVTFVTDYDDYAFNTVECFLQDPKFAPAHPEPHYAPLPEGYGSSFFLELWESKGSSIKHIQFTRSHDISD